jgi:type IV pilus assembly protein PilX
MKLRPSSRSANLMNMSNVSNMTNRAHKQQGATLIVTIMLLLVLTILALSLYQFGNSEERSARNQFDRNLALQAAELALRDAEMDLQCLKLVPNAAPTAPAYEFCTAGTLVKAGETTKCRATCVAGSSLKADRGLRFFDAAGTAGLWAGQSGVQAWTAKTLLGKEYLDDPDATQAVTLGAQTNATIPDIYKTKPPRYMIEGFDQGSSGSAQLLYRITARGWGSLPGTVVTLQEIYKP